MDSILKGVASVVIGMVGIYIIIEIGHGFGWW